MINSPLLYVIKTLIELYTIILMIRVMLQAARADYYNPVAQGIIKITDPVINIFKRFIPHSAKINLPAVVAMFTITFIEFLLLTAVLSPSMPNILMVVMFTLVTLVLLFLKMLMYILIAQVVLSWLNPGTPIFMMLTQMTEPFLGRIRRLLPETGGLDFSPMIMLIIIFLLQAYIGRLLI